MVETWRRGTAGGTAWELRTVSSRAKAPGWAESSGRSKLSWVRGPEAVTPLEKGPPRPACPSHSTFTQAGLP